MPKITDKQYHNIKRNLKKKEQKNYNQIIIIPCSGDKGWHEFAEHSALFYYYDVNEKLRLKRRFFADTMSYYDQYEIGYMRTLSIDKIRTDLKRAKLYQSEEVQQHFTIFKLNKSYTAEEVRILEQKEHARRLENLTVKEAVNLDPELHQLLATTAGRLHRLCNSRLDRLSVFTIGADIVKTIDNMLVEYHQITTVKNVPKSIIYDKLSNMRKESYQLILLVKVLGETKLWRMELCANVSEPLYKIKERIEADLKEMKKQEDKENA